MKQQGFTLIELLVSVGIIGTLSAISVASYQEYRKEAHAAVGWQMVADLQTAAEMFLGDMQDPGFYLDGFDWGRIYSQHHALTNWNYQASTIGNFDYSVDEILKPFIKNDDYAISFTVNFSESAGNNYTIYVYLCKGEPGEIFFSTYNSNGTDATRYKTGNQVLWDIYCGA